ncbi:aldo/keto reductase [Bradyrhizobium canariense]|uniref:Predicted oxidoreductase n=1 Tax=Bradyrhizobium canariense TaxID=255045 RepID=A0A1H1VZX0_9BRAD|nr:aldo/keto reductase [Bradyrhizobium canariense]SDS89990.1 Predicted oxidoreductase [Bradyrhizobium canariense]
MSSHVFGDGASRRQVLRGAAGIAAGSLVSAVPAFGQSDSPIAARAIPHSGEQIPVIGLGTANDFMSQQEGEAKANLKKVVDDLLAQGCKLIDTASSYGAAESVLGDLLSDQDRSKVFLATKIEDGRNDAGLVEFRRSLVRLRYKQVDLLQLHNVQDRHQDLTPFRDWEAQGLCRYVGITTTYKNDYDAAEAVLRKEKPDFFQVDYSLADREAEKRLLPAARDAGAAVLTALPFGRSSVFSAVRGKSVPEWARDFDATTWPQFFLKFLLGHEAVTAVIPGTTNPAHLADNISAGRGRFPDARQRKAMIDFFATL